MEYGGLRVKRKPEDYFYSGTVLSAAKVMGKLWPTPWITWTQNLSSFASDFPHEISLANCMEEIDEIVERKDLKEEHKEAILGDNARRFYKI